MNSELVGNDKIRKNQHGECRPRTWHTPELVRGEQCFYEVETCK